MSHKTWPHKVRFRSTLYLFFPKYKLSVCDQRSSTGRQKKISSFSKVWPCGAIWEKENSYSVIKCLIWTHLVNLKSKWRKDLNHLPNAVFLFLSLFLIIIFWQRCGIQGYAPDRAKNTERVGAIKLLLELGCVSLEVSVELTVVSHRRIKAG